MENIIYGPVPSRRLGKSLGVNNIPPKVCSYSCKYCQVGITRKLEIKRQDFYSPSEIAFQVRKKLMTLSKEDVPDVISIVPDGEPTLDIHLGELIDRLGSYGLPVAVFSNSSLLHLKDVRDELKKADLVSLKVDSVNGFTWKKINRPHKELEIKSILDGIREFSGTFRGHLITETMVIEYLNDYYEEMESVACFLQDIRPEKAYIAIPTRPPAVEGIRGAHESSIMLAYEIFLQHQLDTELLTGYEGNAFAASGNFQEDILSITAVHPMRKDAVMELMKRSMAAEDSLNALIDNGLLVKVNYGPNEYYLRRFSEQHIA